MGGRSCARCVASSADRTPNHTLDQTADRIQRWGKTDGPPLISFGVMLRRGVTLVELLVSVGIIAMLIALVLPAVLTAVENGGAGTVSRRSKMAAHNRAVLCEARIGATAPITPPFRERHRSAQRHGDLERDTT